MVTAKQANYSLNISLHVLILFSFLTILFFAYISHLEQKSVDDALTNAINGQIGQVLTNLDKNHTVGPLVDWKAVSDVATKIQKDAEGELPKVRANHRKLRLIGICMIIGLFALFSGLYIYFRVKGIDINIKRILIENLIVFSFVGLIEFLFFTKIASKYIPVTPDLLSKTILDRVKYRFSLFLSE